MKFLVPFLYSLVKCSGVDGVEIVNHSEVEQTVRTGETMELFCKSSSPYQWCLYEHDGVEYSTTVKGPSATVWGFTWKKSATSCGLLVEKVNTSFAGKWKCHLAHTNQKDDKLQSKIVDERWMEVDVATPAKVEVIEGKDPVAPRGTLIETGCNVLQAGHPVLNLSLEMVNGKDRRIIHSTSGEGIFANHTTELHDTGAVFRCIWSQEKDGVILYSGESVSKPLDVLLPPSLLANTKNRYILENGQTKISVSFNAKPPPTEGEIHWYVLAENQTIHSLENSTGFDYVELPVEPVEGVDLVYTTGLHIANLTQNLSLTLQIWTSVGRTEYIFHVDQPPPPRVYPVTESPSDQTGNTTFLYFLVSDEVYKNNMTAGSIVGLIGGLLFGLLILLLSILLIQKKKRTKRQSVDGDPASWEDKEYPRLLGENDIIRNPSCEKLALTMSTFGKDDSGSSQLTGTLDSVNQPDFNQKDLELVLPSSSSVSTDDLSSLGVRMKEFPDPLASWEDLEPELSSRRSRNIEAELFLRPECCQLSPAHTQVKLSGPTGYPVSIPSPKHSPFNTFQKLHLHHPSELDTI